MNVKDSPTTSQSTATETPSVTATKIIEQQDPTVLHGASGPDNINVIMPENTIPSPTLINKDPIIEQQPLDLALTGGSKGTTPKNEPMELITLAELINLPLRPSVEYVKGLLPEGYTILAARPKEGKSTLANSIALAIATGEKAFGNFAVTKAEVVILALETSPKRMQSDINRMNITHPEGFTKIHYSGQWNPNVSLQAGLNHILTNNVNIKVVIIDTLGRFLDVCGIGHGGYQKTYKVGTMIKAIAEKHSVAIVCLHHLRKGPVGKNSIDDVMGSTGLAAAADNIITLHRSRDTDFTSLEVTGRNIDKAEYHLEFDEETKDFSLVENHSEITLGKEAKALLEHLRASDTLQPLNKLQEFCGKTKTATSNLLKTLVDLKLAEKPSHGKYQAVKQLTVGSDEPPVEGAEM